MAGPWLLDAESIARLESRPGVYVLGRERAGMFYGLYVGRSDADLKRRLEEHLPGGEANPFIRIYAPDRFSFEYTPTAYEAYRIECRLFHSAQYPANLFHPDPGPHADWECPVCGGGASRVREPIRGYATAEGPAGSATFSAPTNVPERGTSAPPLSGPRDTHSAFRNPRSAMN